MQALWRSAKAWKVAAATLLLLAILVIAAVHFSSQKAVAIQGPSALQAISADRFWLGVNKELWVLNAAGQKLSQKTMQELGLTDAVSNMALAPKGEVLLTARGQGTWPVVRASDMQVVRTITPQWPDEFKGNVARAIRVAISPEWDIAVATGGGHTVLLFDKNGALKARTVKDTYYFTNGLWHSPQGWWTTDTNRFVLRLLDTNTLVEKDSIRLTEDSGIYRFLGEMVPSRGAPISSPGQLPVATISRLGPLMEPGHVVDVFPDGSQAVYNKEPLARVQDITWLGDKLLVIDGSSYQILSFSAQREALAPFGSDEVQRAFSSMLSERTFWVQLSSRYMFLIAAALLLAGIAGYSRHKKLAVQAVVAERKTSTVGTPLGSASMAFRQRFRVFVLPLMARLLVILICLLWLAGIVLDFSKRHGMTSPLAQSLVVVLAVCLPIFLVALWQQRRYLRFSALPGYEATLNRQAMAWLLDHADWDEVKQNGESPRETLVLRGRWIGWRKQWLLVTNQRVLLFAANARESGLVSAWPRSAVVFAGLPWQDGQGGRPPTLLSRWLIPHVNLRLRLGSGELVTGICPSSVTVTRTAHLLMQTKVAPSASTSASQSADKLARQARRRNRRWHQVIASTLVPGLGQWLQDRFVTGTIYFTTAALLMLLVVGPVLWASDGPKMHVSELAKTRSLFWWLLLVAVAAWDAYQFSGGQARRKSVRSNRAN